VERRGHQNHKVKHEKRQIETDATVAKCVLDRKDEQTTNPSNEKLKKHGGYEVNLTKERARSGTSNEGFEPRTLSTI